MKNNNTVKTVLSSLIGAISLSVVAQAQAAAPSQPPIAQPGEYWILQERRSDEFDFKDSSKWSFEPENFGVWSWRTSNSTVNNGKLQITTRRQDHSRRFWDGCNQRQVENFPLYYTSGIAKSKVTGNYGYYEARIKGAHTYPGVAPAFWMYSAIDRSLTNNGDVQYSEIDVVELTQKNNARITDHDLHNIVVINGQPTWQRPLQVAFNHNTVTQNWDPRNDFHTYGVNVTEDDITWYVDGVEIATKENRYWHRQMFLTLSQGLRHQLTHFRCNQFYPSDTRPSQGFPTTMEVDYVRTWFKTQGNNPGPAPTPSPAVTSAPIATPTPENPSCNNGWTAVSGVEITPASRNLSRGQTLATSTTVLPSCASNKSVTYSSSNSSVAAVNSSGVITARGNGTATITVRTKNLGRTDTVQINVGSGNNPVSPTPTPVVTQAPQNPSGGSCNSGWNAVSGVEITPASRTLSRGQTLATTTNVLPSCASNKRVTYSSSNAAVAIVNTSGVITARGSGTATITVRTKNLGRTDTVRITVN